MPVSDLVFSKKFTELYFPNVTKRQCILAQGHYRSTL